MMISSPGLLARFIRPTALLVIAFSFGAGIGQARADDLSAYPPLRNLTEIKSVDGVLSTTIEATEQQLHFGTQTVDGSVYNGDYAGPVLRLHPGEELKIKFVNHLSRLSNLHFHGLQSSPLGHGDTMHVVVSPRESFDYDLRIPKTQPPGLYWYHDHIHGSAERNVTEGLSGALIVEGLTDAVPELKGLKEKIFVLKDYPLAKKDAYFHKLVQSINGQIASRLDMAPHEKQIWRFSNQSSNFYFDLRLQGHKFRVISQDGGTRVDTQDQDILKISPASRVEVLVDAGEVGVYDLISEGTSTGSGADATTDRILGKLVVKGKPAAAQTETLTLPKHQDLRERTINEHRVFTLTQDNDDEHFFINGQLFNHERIDTRVPLGNVEEWTIKNDTDDMHIFHIHQVSFQVTSINGVAQPFTGYVDTIRIPERGEVKVILPFIDPIIVGQFMYHCHVLKHEDRGMMANIEVYDPNAGAASAEIHHH